MQHVQFRHWRRGLNPVLKRQRTLLYSEATWDSSFKATAFHASLVTFAYEWRRVRACNSYIVACRETRRVC